MKWDNAPGMATHDHTPSGRGYNTSLHCESQASLGKYSSFFTRHLKRPLPVFPADFHHDNDYWNDKVGGCDWNGAKNGTSFFEFSLCLS